MLNNDVTLIIKEKLSIRNIISSKIRIIKKGNSYIALCPFHTEKTPSFHINEAKGLFHCFGCGESGDIFKFIMLYNKITFKEALEYLANIAGVTLKKYNENYHAVVTLKKDTLHKPYSNILDLTAHWFHEQLFLPENKFALQYLFDRGYSEYTIKTFKIGYAPNEKEKFLNFLIDKGFTKEQLIKVGLIGIHNNKDYLVFKNRIMFPIKNKDGRIIAFGGRSLNNEIPKYLNSKDSDLFHKKLNLYGLQEVVKEFKKLNHIILVEGYLDVLALYQNNLPAVATLGTAISIEQLNILINLRIPLYICLDGDVAGTKAALKVANLLLEVINVTTIPKFIILPNADDPDSFLKKNSKTDFINLMKEAIPLSEFLWQAASSDIDFCIPESKALLQKKLNTYTRKLQDQDLRNIFKDYFETKLHNSFFKLFFKQQINYNKVKAHYNSSYNTLNKYNNNSVEPVFSILSNNSLLKETVKNNLLLREYYLVAYIIFCPQIYNNIEKEFSLLTFHNKELDELKQAIVVILEKNILDSEKITLELEKDGFNTILNKIINVFFITKAMNRLKTPEDFLSAFHDTYNRILFNSLKNDVVNIKEAVLQDKDNIEQSFSKATIKLRHLYNEIKQTKVFKGKL